MADAGLVACPRCGAKAGNRCHNGWGNTTSIATHRDRKRLAEQLGQEAADAR